MGDQYNSIVSPTYNVEYYPLISITDENYHDLQYFFNKIIRSLATYNHYALQDIWQIGELEIRILKVILL